MTLDLRGKIARGGAAAEKMADENKPSGGKFDKVDWFALKDKERITVRFLDDHDEWFSVLQHPFTPTRPAPEDWTDDQKKNWPRSMGPVCRKTKEFVAFFPDGCYICDVLHTVVPNEKTKNKRYYPAVRLWARAVVREEVRVETEAEAAEFGKPIGSVVGRVDAGAEVDETDAEGNPTGKKVWKPRILVINQPMSTFFGQLQGYADVYGTVLDRDYSITRKGEGKDTDYNAVSLDPVEHGDGNPLDIRTSPELAEDGSLTGRSIREYYDSFGPDLVKLIEDRIDDEMYHRFFDRRVPIPDRKSDGGENGSTPSATSGDAAEKVASAPAQSAPPKADQGATAEKLRRMREKVRAQNPTPPSSEDGAGSQEESVGAGVSS